MSIQKAQMNRAPLAQSRVMAGVPAGGQFAAMTHSESPVVLGGLDDRELNERLAQYTTVNEFVEMAWDSASYWVDRYGMKRKSNTTDVDDVAQESMLHVLKMVREGKEIKDFRQLLNSVTANVTVRNTQNVFRAEDRRAYRIFEEKRSALEAELGRRLTTREEDTIEKQVLAEWHDPRHKPSKDFRVPFTVDASLDRPFLGSDGVESTLGANLVNPESTGNYIEPDSYMDRAYTALETTGAAHKAEARRLAWNALAERADMPLALAGTVSQRKVTDYRKVMEAQEAGVMTACRDWSNGVNTPATEALFAPFGTLDDDGQEKVVEMLERVSAKHGTEGAGQIWEGALAFANNKHKA